MPLSSDPEKRARQLANLTPAPPVPPDGNTRRLTHGGYATIVRARLDEKMREVFDALAGDAPLREADGSLPAADALVVELLAECICRRENLREYLADYGWRDDESKEPKTAVLDLERRLRREAAGYADALGMTPRSRVRLGLDVVRVRSHVDASRALSEARKEADPIRREQLLREAGLSIDAKGASRDE